MPRRKPRLNVVSQNEHSIRARLRSKVAFALHAYNQLITLERDTAIVAATGLSIEVINALQARKRAVESGYVQRLHPTINIAGPKIVLLFLDDAERSWPQTGLSLPSEYWNDLLGTHRPLQIVEAATIITKLLQETRTNKPNVLHFLCPELASLVKALLDELYESDAYEWDIGKPVPKRAELANTVRMVRGYADVFSELMMVPPASVSIRDGVATKGGARRLLHWAG